MSISSMKYAADLYHIKKTRQEQVSSSSSFSATQPASFRSIKQTQSLPLNQLPPSQTQTLHNISTETLNGPTKEGFISFADFSKPQRHSNKASQISLSSNNKNSSVQYSWGSRTNENYQFIANKIPV
jgi:hypothetical protein